MSREAMKLALEALIFNQANWQGKDKAITILKQALEQPEPETVECHTCKGLGRIYMGCGSWIHCDTCNTTGKATTPPKREPEPEIEAWIKKDRSSIEVSIMTAEYMMEQGFEPLYTSPPKREWQGLTDEEVQMFIDARWGDGVNFTHFIRAIEAKLKEKNT